MPVREHGQRHVDVVAGDPADLLMIQRPFSVERASQPFLIGEDLAVGRRRR